MRRPRRACRAAGAKRNRLRAWSSQPALDVARGAAARSRRKHHLLLQGGRKPPLPALAHGLIHKIFSHLLATRRALHRLGANGAALLQARDRVPEPLAGVDEAGCAPLAGPVVAAAVMLDRSSFPRGIDDSKALPRAGARGDLRQAGQKCARDRRRASPPSRRSTGSTSSGRGCWR